MPSPRNDVRAGLFIVGSAVAVLALVLAISGPGQLLSSPREYTASFRLTDDISGLQEGDPVRLGGAKVGAVRSIEFQNGPTGRVEFIAVRFTLPERFELASDAVIRVQSQVTGGAVLNIASLGAGPPLVEGEVIQAQPGGLVAAIDSFGRLIPDLRSTVERFRETTLPKIETTVDSAGETLAAFRETAGAGTALVRRIDGRVEPLLDRYGAVADNAAQAAGHLSDLFGESKGDLRTSASNLAASSGALRERLPGILERLDSALSKVDRELDSAAAALTDFRESMANTRQATGEVRSILVGNRGRIDAMLVSLKTTADNLKAASGEIRRAPWRLLYKPRPGEMENLDLYDSARLFAEGAARMSEAATALRDTARDAPADAARLADLVRELDERFVEFEKVQVQFLERVQP